jgi:hypothetical protein
MTGWKLGPDLGRWGGGSPPWSSHLLGEARAPLAQEPSQHTYPPWTTHIPGG